MLDFTIGFMLVTTLLVLGFLFGYVFASRKGK